MRKTSFDTDSPAAESWLDLDKIAHVAVTSEDPNSPIEFAFEGGASGWRAGGKGEQTIRLAFNKPQRIRRIFLRFVETESERTQEFSLQWRPDRRGKTHEIVRQQWNFSPHGATTEIEDYKVDLDGVGILELRIIPDVSHSDSVATLADWRVG